MGTTGIFDMEQDVKSKLTLDRRKFIEWAIIDEPSLFTPLQQIKADLIAGGEFILEAQTILDTYNEIPSHLVMETIDEPFVDPQNCVLSYFTADYDSV